MSFKTIYIFLRNNVSKTKLFWKYRHLIQPAIWKSYKEDYNSTRREYYSEIIKKENLYSVFEFGCASGPNFFSIKKNISEFIYFGYDISKPAINSVKRYNNNQVKFSSKFSFSILKNFLNFNNYPIYDLVIFDRVLYMLTESQTRKLLNEIHEIINFVLIEDFYSEEPTWDDEKYIYAKNYIKIFESFGFILIENKKSNMKSSSAKNYARRILLKKN